VKPQFIVISAGEDNRYGPSRREVLQRVIDVAAAVLRADVLGTIKLATDGHWIGRGSRSWRVRFWGRPGSSGCERRPIGLDSLDYCPYRTASREFRNDL
jgi:hypothetical protein